MKPFQDPILGTMHLVDEIDGAGSWEFAVSTPEGELNGSIYGPAAAPPEHFLLKLHETVQYLPTYRAEALDAIVQSLKNDPEWLGELEENWLAMSSEEFSSRHSLQYLLISQDDLPVLIFETDLDGEHGIGVEFEDGKARRVDLGSHF